MFMWTSCTNECRLETLWNQWLNIICQEWQYQRNTAIETIYRIRYMYKTYHENFVDTSNFIIITVNINVTWLIDKFNCKVVFNYNCVVSNHKRDETIFTKTIVNIWFYFYFWWDCIFVIYENSNFKHEWYKLRNFLSIKSIFLAVSENAMVILYFN